MARDKGFGFLDSGLRNEGTREVRGVAPKEQGKIPAQDPNEKLKWDTARELGLDDDLAAGGDELSVREAGKIGGNMVKKLVEEGKEKIQEEQSAESGEMER